MTTTCREVVFPPSEPTQALARGVMLSDLARFAPDPSSFSLEPGGVGVAGLPTNFVVLAAPHTRTESVLDTPVSIRFTPVAYEYTYGDGTSASITTPGRTWADLGQAQFTPTPTSHVYRLRGVYFADVDVRYTAEVDLGGGWMPVTGEVRTDGPPQRIRVLEARTALVAHTCTERRDAPGC